MTHNDVRALIRGLDSKALPLEWWTHDAHLAMSVWYLTYLPRRQALRVIRHRIASYNKAHALSRAGRRRYHETVTTFLSRGVAAFLDALPEELGFDERLARVRVAFGDFRALLRRFYSTRAIESPTARARWFEPDRRPMREWLRLCEEAAGAPFAAPLRVPLAAAC